MEDKYLMKKYAERQKQVKKRMQQLEKETKEAKEKGISYGELQAQKYIEAEKAKKKAKEKDYTSEECNDCPAISDECTYCPVLEILPEKQKVFREKDFYK